MVGDSPPLMSEELVTSREIVKQTDFGFGVDARAGPGGLSSSDLPLHIRSSPHDLCHGWELPCWLLAEQQTDSKLGKECIKAVYCHPAYLNYMQSTS